MRFNRVRICPICKNKYSEEPAISRLDNKTKICSMCGLREALIDFVNSTEEKKCEDC